MQKLDYIDYKRRNIKIWNEIAPRYHKRWASINAGPFQGTKKLIELCKIKNGQKVLDVACGTGVVTKEIFSKIGETGYVVGIDSSITAIKIAKRWARKKTNVDFLNIDAEKFSFSEKFDVITCQYALFFFPNAQTALHNMKKNLKKAGTIGISVHGYKKKVPYFSSIIDSITEIIPDYIPPGSPDLDRFGKKSALREIVSSVGFSKIILKDYVFQYSPGSFNDYWNNYIRYIAKPLKEKLDSLQPDKKKMLKENIRMKTKPFTKRNGRIVFPWQVLILTAKNDYT